MTRSEAGLFRCGSCIFAQYFRRLLYRPKLNGARKQREPYADTVGVSIEFDMAILGECRAVIAAGSGQAHRAEALAVGEGICLDDGNALRNHHAREAGTIGKGRRLDQDHAVGNGSLFEIRAVGEGAGLDHGNIGAEFHAYQEAEIVEGRTFPQERLILQSLLNRWNAFSGDYPIEDEDAIRMLERGIHFGDYALRSQRYPLKATSIPGFMGDLTMISRLPAPIQELWTTLLRFAPYSGIGIKTALGMGGIRIQ